MTMVTPMTLNMHADRVRQAVRRRAALHRRRQSPFAQEIPDADAEVERGGQSRRPGKMRRTTDSACRCQRRVSGHPCVSQRSVYKMPRDIRKSEQPRLALNVKSQFFTHGYAETLIFPAQPYVKSVSRVIEQRQKDDATRSAIAKESFASSSEVSSYFCAPTRAALLDQKCSARNAPTGTMPVNEWSLRKK